MMNDELTSRLLEQVQRGLIVRMTVKSSGFGRAMRAEMICQASASHNDLPDGWSGWRGSGNPYQGMKAPPWGRITAERDKDGIGTHFDFTCGPFENSGLLDPQSWKPEWQSNKDVLCLLQRGKSFETLPSAHYLGMQNLGFLQGLARGAQHGCKDEVDLRVLHAFVVRLNGLMREGNKLFMLNFA